LKAGLLHVQFETIHPFLDGNGRLGRLLITLYLCAQGVLKQPLLYLSLYFKTHRADYYRLLQEVREYGSWEAWLEFFLDGVRETANQAFDTATRISDLLRRDRERIRSEAQRASSVLRLHEAMQKMPYISSPMAVQRRGRVYAYADYLAILEEGTQPLDSTAAVEDTVPA